MSRSNPQLILNKEFDVWLEGAKQSRRDYKVSQVALMAKNKLEKASQEMLFEAQNVMYKNMYTKVGELQELGYPTFDTNKNAFFEGQVDKYFDIKNGIDSGKVNQRDGQKALAQIMGQVQQYRAAAPAVLAQAKMLQEAMKIPPGQPGAISNRVPTAQQKVLLGLIQGEDVGIVDRGGQLVLFKPGKEGEEGAIIDVNELINLEKSGIEYFTKVPDISEQLSNASTNVIGSTKTGGLNAAYITFGEQKSGTMTVTTKTMTDEQRAAAEQDMIKTKQLDPILDNDDYMKSVWADMMDKDTDWQIVGGDTPEEIESNLQKQRDEAEQWLANKAITDNTAAQGVKQIIGSPKKVSKGGGGGGGGGDSEKKHPWTLATKEEYDLNEKDYQQYVQDAPSYVGSFEKTRNLGKKLKSLNPGNDYISLTKKQVTSPEYVEKWINKQIDKGLWTDEDAPTVEEMTGIVNNSGDVIIVNGDLIEGIHGVNTEDEVIDLLATVHGISDKGRKALKSQNPYEKKDKAAVTPLDTPSKSFKTKKT